MTPLQQTQEVEQLVRSRFPFVQTKLLPCERPILDIRLDGRLIVIDIERFSSKWILAEVGEDHAFDAGPIVGAYDSTEQLLEALSQLIGDRASQPRTAVKG